jgi:23S rRNA (adenine2503-C2)-methyltransferase
VTSATRFDLDFEALVEYLADQPAYRARQVWHGLYEQLASPADITTIPRALRERIDHDLPPALRCEVRRVSDHGDTVKYLWRLRDERPIETVLMLYRDRVTVCVSSQAGCAMGCGFCATGQAGFERHLTTGEIVEQVVRAASDAQQMQRRLANIVFMGMGEPLANEGPVRQAVERLHGSLGLSARNITVSTVGIIPGIEKMASWPLPVNLAVSLHAANDRLRDELVPINRRYPIDALITSCAGYLAASGRRISFEWAMIHNVNDRTSDARELAALCRQLRPAAHVNLIPLNPTPGYGVRGSSPRRVQQFKELLEAERVNATVRRNRGTDIDAACGQLAAGQAVAITPAPDRTA